MIYIHKTPSIIRWPSIQVHALMPCLVLLYICSLENASSYVKLNPVQMGCNGSSHLVWLNFVSTLGSATPCIHFHIKFKKNNIICIHVASGGKRDEVIIFIGTVDLFRTLVSVFLFSLIVVLWFKVIVVSN